MRINVLVSALTAAASLAAVVPATASAQSYGGYAGRGYPAYGYGDRGYYASRHGARRDAWAARERWEQRRAWRERQRWERREARRRYWSHVYQSDGYGYGGY
jgi:hypothetical protein